MDKNKQDEKRKNPDHTKSPGDINRDKDSKNPQRKAEAKKA